MAKQLQKKFTDSQVKELIERYLKKEIERKYIILGIKKTRFFELVADYRRDPSSFSIQYTRRNKNKIPPSTENNIKEIKIEKRIIEDKDVPSQRDIIHRITYGALLPKKNGILMAQPLLINR